MVRVKWGGLIRVWLEVRRKRRKASCIHSVIHLLLRRSFFGGSV
jgi:hypothetical protein